MIRRIFPIAVLVGWLFLMFVTIALSAPDTISYSGISPRLPNMEIALQIQVWDVRGGASDSVGDSLYIEMQGRDSVQNGSAYGLSNYTSWQKCYFNVGSCPDYVSPAVFPSVDSIIKVKMPDSSWIRIPTLSTGLYDYVRVKCTVTQGNNRKPSKGTSTRIIIQILQRMETPFGKSRYTTSYDTLVGG